MTPKEIAAQISRFANAQERDDAYEILARTGAEVVPALIAALTQPAAQFQTQAWAAKTLGSIGAPAVAAVPYLIAVLKSNAHNGIRQHAAIALGKLGPLSPEQEAARGALETATHDGDGTICRKADAALQMF